MTLGALLLALAALLLASLHALHAARRRGRLQAQRFDQRLQSLHEAHDGLLQDLQGPLLQLHVLSQELPAGDPLRARLGGALMNMEMALAEGRRQAPHRAAAPDGLAQALNETGLELARGGRCRFGLSLRGRVRRLQPLAQEELYSIASEALLNAFRHGGATRVELELRYGFWAFQLHLRDDGVGIPPEVLAGKRAGQWGLAGMRERAACLGATLRIRSTMPGGTELRLSLAARRAYLDD